MNTTQNIKIELSRRGFIQGISLSMTGLVISPFGLASQLSHYDSMYPPQVVIYQDKAHFDYEDVLDAYLPPKTLSSSTQRYVDSLSNEEFLSRHWFV